MKNGRKIYATVACFKQVPTFFQAVGRVRDAHYKKWDTFVPFPVHGLGKQMGMSRSKVPYFTLSGAALGFSSAVLMTWYMNGLNYPLIVGGKPFWSMVYPAPILYELTILLAAFGTLLGMFLTNGLPRHHHPIFNYKNFIASSDDTLLIVIEAADPLYQTTGTPAFLESLGAEKVEHILAE